MNRIIIWTFLVLCTIISSVFARIILLDKWVNDCMIDYVMSNQKYWYIYRIGTLKYHIDTENISNMEKIGVSNWCIMVNDDKKISFVAIANTFYCWIVSIMV
jgi:hypothetical protein